MSLMLFLTVSFHSAPYYTGADIVFAFVWTPLLLAGSGPVLSLDVAVRHLNRPYRRHRVSAVRAASRRLCRSRRPGAPAR